MWRRGRNPFSLATVPLAVFLRFFSSEAECYSGKPRTRICLEGSCHIQNHVKGAHTFSRLEVSSVWTSTIRTGSQRSGSSPDHSPKSHLPPGNTKLPHLGRAAAGSTRPDCHQRSPGIRCLRNSSAFPDQKPNHLLRPSGSLLRLHPPLGPRVRSQGPRLPEGPRSADA